MHIMPMFDQEQALSQGWSMFLGFLLAHIFLSTPYILHQLRLLVRLLLPVRAPASIPAPATAAIAAPLLQQRLLPLRLQSITLQTYCREFAPFISWESPVCSQSARVLKFARS
ncbi:hypothetical protein AWENTII_011996 [Aspergillus wentii]